MLASMVAMPQLDLVITTAWVGMLVAALLGQAVWAWLGYRRAARYAREAARLARATRPVTGRAQPIALPEDPKRVSA
jgi:hypothetical protein